MSESDWDDEFTSGDEDFDLEDDDLSDDDTWDDEGDDEDE